jgi:proline dehydrogenase
MGLMRRALLAASESRWLGEHAPRYAFFQRTTKRFMPGETVEDALEAAAALSSEGIATVLTHLGENIADRAEAESVTRHYLDVQERIQAANLPTEISVKLTQLGLDLDREFCLAHLEELIQHSSADKTVWVDMERSPYVDQTLEIYRRMREKHRNTGVCVQSYLYRTEKDVEGLIALGAAVRLVKGAYHEPATIAFPQKKDVDENFFRLAQRLLSQEAQRAGVRAGMATHDEILLRRICRWGEQEGITKSGLEFQLLYGIRRREQLRLAREGYRTRVLISYGPFWFPWFMRRLAERPANVLFLMRNLMKS